MERSDQRKPRLGFAGVGWIGRNRMAAVAESGLAEIAAVADTDPACCRKAGELAPGAACLGSFEDLLGLDLDGIVIATPSAQHAAQTAEALRRGYAVFCQKPLGRTLHEHRMVIDAARSGDRLLGVDLSYRHVRGIGRMKALIESGAIGRVFGGSLVFHNAYGPDKDWFYDPAQSGGGCVIDLGTHLIDLARWMLGFPAIESAGGSLFANGEPVLDTCGTVEDYATMQLAFAGGAVVDIACSWRLSAGRDALIEVSFYGTDGGVSLRNINGSFYDFVAERYTGTSREVLAAPPDDWGKGAILAWAGMLSVSPSFDSTIEQIVGTAQVIDWIYGRNGVQVKRG